MNARNGSATARCLLAALLGVGLLAATAAAETDFILRAPVAEVDEIAVRNGLTVIEEVASPADPEGQGIYRVRAAEGVSPETVLEAVEELEPTVVGIEEVIQAKLPELDQSVMSILDQSVMSILDGLMTIRALTPPLGQAGPGLPASPEDRTIKKIKTGDKYEYQDKKLVLHMQEDENRKRQDVTLRADFSPGCFVEYNRGEVPPVEAVSGLMFNGRKVEWEIINNTVSPLTVSRVDVEWPAANQRLKKVKLGKDIKEFFDPPSVSVDFEEKVENPEDRQIKAENTEKLTLEFELDAGVRQADYSIVVTFAEGLSVASAPCSVIAMDDPRYDKEKLQWTLINQSHDDVILESVTVGWPSENGLITKIELGGKPIFATETAFGKIFNGKKEEDRLVWVGYVDQLAATILRVEDAQKENKGYSTVAIIDTGVDPDHWLLADNLVPGYDFLRDEVGYGSEVDGVLDQSVMSILDAAGHMPLEEEELILLNQSVMSILDAEQGAALNATDLPPAFGHGTMVAGVIHRVAPQASIMPLRVFDGNGQADLLDIVAAVYYAVEHGANVINMSFSIDTFSPELMRAINYAARNGVSCIASAGNEGQETIVYPAAFGNTIGVASTSHLDEISLFSNLGSDLVTVAAPGEAVVTTFPGGGWAVASGTSFAAPWISGVAAIFADKNGHEHQPGRSDFFLASEALSHAIELVGEGEGRAGHGRADFKEAVDKLKDSADFGSTGVSDYPYLIVVDFAEGCSVAYPPAAFGGGCDAQVAAQLEVDGDEVELEITNAGGETITVARIEVSWPAEHLDLEKIKLDSSSIFEQDLAAPWALVDSGWRDPEDPEKRQIEPGDTVRLRFEFDEEAGS